MRLLILTCLVAVALARPKLPLSHPELSKNEPDSSEEVLKKRKYLRFAVPAQSELREEDNNELNRQRELLREKESDEFKATRKGLSEERVIADAEQKESSSSSSEEAAPNNTEAFKWIFPQGDKDVNGSFKLTDHQFINPSKKRAPLC